MSMPARVRLFINNITGLCALNKAEAVVVHIRTRDMGSKSWKPVGRFSTTNHAPIQEETPSLTLVSDQDQLRLLNRIEYEVENHKFITALAIGNMEIWHYTKGWADKDTLDTLWKETQELYRA